MYMFEYKVDAVRWLRCCRRGLVFFFFFFFLKIIKMNALT